METHLLAKTPRETVPIPIGCFQIANSIEIIERFSPPAVQIY